MKSEARCSSCALRAPRVGPAGSAAASACANADSSLYSTKGAGGGVCGGQGLGHRGGVSLIPGES